MGQPPHGSWSEIATWRCGARLLSSGNAGDLIDKDPTAALLAEDLKADFLLILTDVPNVYADFGTPKQRPVLDATPAELRRAGFPARSMGPEAEAAARFVERTGGLAASGALDAACETVHGRSGTLVRPALPTA